MFGFIKKLFCKPKKEQDLHIVKQSFENKSVVLVGTFEKLTKKEASQYIQVRGGFVRSHVSNKTDIIVKAYDSDFENSAFKRDYDKITAKGKEISIINEADFYSLIEVE